MAGMTTDARRVARDDDPSAAPDGGVSPIATAAGRRQRCASVVPATEAEQMTSSAIAVVTAIRRGVP